MVGKVSAIALSALAASALLAAASTGPVAVEAGDTLAIAGTNVQCTVSLGEPRAIVCLLGRGRSAVAKSYATAVTDEGALIFDATGMPRAVATRSGARVGGPLQTAPHHRPEHVTLPAGARVDVVGSHIQCTVAASGTVAAGARAAAAQPSFDCGLVSAPGQRDWVPGTYVSAISDQRAALLLAGRDGATTTTVSARQP